MIMIVAWLKWPHEQVHHRVHLRSSIVHDLGQYCYFNMSGASLRSLWFSLEVVS